MQNKINNKKIAARYFWVFEIIDLKIKVENNRSQSKYDKK